MLDSKTLDSIAKRLYESIPTGLRGLEHGLEQKLREILQTVFAKLDLVTREEFDTQVRVLSRTRAKVGELEKQVALLLAQSAEYEKNSQNTSKNKDKSHES